MFVSEISAPTTMQWRWVDLKTTFYKETQQPVVFPETTGNTVYQRNHLLLKWLTLTLHSITQTFLNPNICKLEHLDG